MWCPVPQVQGVTCGVLFLRFVVLGVLEAEGVMGGALFLRFVAGGDLAGSWGRQRPVPG